MEIIPCTSSGVPGLKIIINNLIELLIPKSLLLNNGWISLKSLSFHPEELREG